MRPPVAAALAAALAISLGAGAARAYPDYQKWVQKTSGRVVSCGLCHAHPDGPDGIKHGQIGSLTPVELQALGRARAALDPGQKIDSPILNAFGDSIIERVGKKRFLLLRHDPAALAPLLGDGDLDGDGVKDADEYLAGTDPLNPHHGPPGRLLAINLSRYAPHLALLTLATVLGLWGFGHLFRWFATSTRTTLARLEDKK